MTTNQISVIKLQASSGNVWVTEPNGEVHHLDGYKLDDTEVCKLVSDAWVGKNDIDAPVYEVTFCTEDGCILVGTWLNTTHYKNDKLELGF